MEAAVKLVLQHLSTYIRILINLIVSPRVFPNEAKLFSTDRLDDALVFFGVSLVASLVVKTPFIPDTVDPWAYMAMDGVWKLILVGTASVAMSVAWLGCRGRIQNYLVANCYFFGVLFIAVPLMILIGSELAALPPAIGAPYFSLCLIALTVWCIGVWLSYGLHNGTTTWRSLLRLPLFILFLPPLALAAALVRSGTVRQTVVEAGGADYAHAGIALVTMATFGLYP
ncbi:hypothetical protein H0Z60_01940 [Ectothiorhodospiraceae bacterium WFHF3C12]|nr:hypothetical protein [Ectothiorhodospiraceae bacterium WFHF3C12]